MISSAGGTDLHPGRDVVIMSRSTRRRISDEEPINTRYSINDDVPVGGLGGAGDSGPSDYDDQQPLIEGEFRDKHKGTKCKRPFVISLFV